MRIITNYNNDVNLRFTTLLNSYHGWSDVRHALVSQYNLGVCFVRPGLLHKHNRPAYLSEGDAHINKMTQRRCLGEFYTSHTN